MMFITWGDHKSNCRIRVWCYRIGSSVEFDWCGVQALNTILIKEGIGAA